MLGPLLIALGIILLCAVLGDAPPPPRRDITVTHYTGPLFSPHGREIRQGGLRYV